MHENRPLEEMTLQELWQLFPIYLVPPQPRWREQYREMEVELRELLAECPVERISHIGSTAISGIWAKDIVDVLVELAGDLERAADMLRNAGFRLMCAEGERISLNWGYTESGFAEKVYHIHLRLLGDNDEVFFRDYMNAHPRQAKAYEALKLSLWKKYEHDRDSYTQAKTDFIRFYTEEEKGKRAPNRQREEFEKTLGTTAQ